MKNRPNNSPKNTHKGKTKDTSTPEPIDTFGWVTTVPKHNKLSRLQATTDYRLSFKKLQGIAFMETTYGKNKEMKCYKYTEIEVVRRAWEVHGGPSGLWYKLRAEYEAHIREKKDVNSFHFPHDYKPEGLYDVTLTSPPVLRDRYVNGSATLERAKAILPSWLWDACNTELDVVLLGGRRPDTVDKGRKAAMVSAVRFYSEQRARYDGRPEAPYNKASMNVTMLRFVLSGKPGAPAGGEQDAAKSEALDWIPRETNNGYFEWSAVYLEKVFSKLCLVVEECGPGLNGWAGVRWLMYEEYSKSIGRSLRYDPLRQTWDDPAGVWLEAKLPDEEAKAGLRGKCESGMRYNSLLPDALVLPGSSQAPGAA